MKKLLFALCAVMMLGMTACNKDNGTTEPGGNGGGGNPPFQMPTGDGVFNPAQRILSVAVDGATTEEWTWANDVVTTIATADENGNLVETGWYQYDNYRLASATTTLQGMPVDVSYTYSGDQLTLMSLTSGGMEVMSIVPTRNAAGKVSHLTMDINPTLLALISDLFSGGIPNIFGTKGAGKFSVNSTAFSADLTWQGDNVSRMILNAQITGSVSLSEIRQMVNLDSLAGGYATMLSMLVDTSAIPLTIAMADTASYTYDSQHNPFYGFLGALEPTNLSANNATASTNSGTATVTLTLNFGVMQMPFTIPYPMGTTTETRTYTYNAAGFPTSFTNGEGSVTQYTYQQ